MEIYNVVKKFYASQEYSKLQWECGQSRFLRDIQEDLTRDLVRTIQSSEIQTIDHGDSVELKLEVVVMTPRELAKMIDDEARKLIRLNIKQIDNN
jgi:hypothetical protein